MGEVQEKKTTKECMKNRSVHQTGGPTGSASETQEECTGNE